MKRDLSKPLASTFGDEPKGRSLKAAMKPKSAKVEISKIKDDAFVTRKAKATGMDGRAIEDWGSDDNLGFKNKGIGEYSTSGKYYGESRDASARKTVTNAANKAKIEQRRKEIYKKVDAKMAAKKK